MQPLQVSSNRLRITVPLSDGSDGQKFAVKALMVKQLRKVNNTTSFSYRKCTSLQETMISLSYCVFLCENDQSMKLIYKLILG